jgi:curli biogenesis system outer membrane secretion channel CsgG
MKKFFILLTISLITSACSEFDIIESNASTAAEASSIKRIAVLDFDYERPETGKIERGKIDRANNAGTIVADIFAEYLLGTNLYQVLERKQIQSILQKHNLKNSDLFNSEKWQKIKQSLNVDGLVIGVVMEYGDWYSKINWGGVAAFSARLVEVESGVVVWSVSANRNIALSNSASVAREASEDAINQLLSKTKNN